MPILDWDRDQPAILDRLRSKSKFKICCKTVSEPELVRSWIEHHSSIIGAENLIIADNGSVDPATLKIYERFRNDVTIFRFLGPHNDIHWHPRFKPLFDVLRETVYFFSFFDVDERLIWIAHNGWRADEQIVARLEETSAIYPTTWLINAIASASRFTLLDTERRPSLSNNLKWGKPILPPPLIGVQAGIHNIQYAGHKFSTICASNLFLLHLTQFPEQRIAANVKKLANRGLVEPSISPAAIPSMDFSAYPDKTVLRFQGEIAEMIAYLKGDRSISSRETEWLELAADGSAKYSSEEARATLFKHIDEGATTIKNMFK